MLTAPSAPLTTHADRSRVDMAISDPTAVERFWPKVLKSDGCWLWQGCVQGNGYARFRAGGRTVYAHRFSYELHNGPIPEGLMLDHLCRTPRCVRPDHLEAVTNRENTVRGLGPLVNTISPQARAAAWAINRNKTHCAKGHAYDAENTRYCPDGSRRCAQCCRDRARAHWRRKHPLRRSA